MARFFMRHPFTLFKNPHRGDEIVDWIKDDEFKQEFLQKRAEKNADLQAFHAFEGCEMNAGLEPHQLMVRAVQSANLQLVRGCILKYPGVDVEIIDDTVGKSAHELAQELKDNNILNYLLLLPCAQTQTAKL